MIQNNYYNIDIANMSIDNIKRLTNTLITNDKNNKMLSLRDIYTLTGASPEIVDVSAYFQTFPSMPVILVLWKNTSGTGWVNIEGWARETPTGPDTKIAEFANCFETSSPGLGYLQQLFITGNPIPFLYGWARTYYCPIGAVENCVIPATCSTPTIQMIYPNIPFMLYDSMIPTTPPSLSITAGDGELTISWGESTGPVIFAYSVRVEGNVLKFGHSRASIRTVTVGGLTNNISYNVEVRAVSTSNIPSNPVIGSGTPIPPCPTMGIPTLTIQ